MDQFMTFVLAHWPLCLLFVVLLVTVFVLEQQGSVQGIAQASTAEAVNWINHRGAVLIDARTRAAFEASHIAQAMHCELADLKKALPKKLERAKASPVIVYGQRGPDAIALARALKGLGFRELFHLTGGFAGWQAAQLPVVKES